MSLTWSKGTAVGSSGLYLKCIWAGGSINKFIAVGGRSGVTKKIATSPDGITWTARTVTTNGSWASVAFDGTTLVAVGATNLVMTSTDGITWTDHAIANTFTDICWSASVTAIGGGGQFVAVAAAGANRAATSPDGLTWTGRTAASALAWGALDWSPSLQLYVASAISASASALMSSPDGITWTTRTNPVGAIPLAQCGVCWGAGAGKFVVGFNSFSNHVLSSSDGLTFVDWAGAPAGWGSHPLSHIAWAPELSLFLASSADTINFVATSPDGSTWTKETITDGATDFSKAWGGVGYSPTLSSFVVLLNSDTADITALGVGAIAQALSPSSSNDSGNVTVTITGSGVNGGFTNQIGSLFVVVFYPFAALGASAPDFLTNYFLGGTYALGLQATNVTWVDANHLTCTPPHGCGEGSQYGLTPGPIAVDVAVFDITKLPINGANCQFYMAGGFTYVDPVMLSVSPTSGTVLGGEAITITGTNFYADQGTLALGQNTLRFGQAPALCTFVNSTTLTCEAPPFFGGVDPIVDLVFQPSHLTNDNALSPLSVFVPADTTLLNAYTYIAVWWVFDPTLGFEFDFFDLEWEDFDFGFDIGVLGQDQFVWYYFSLTRPGRGWVSTTAPSTNGWWMSIEGFAGSVLVVANSRPKNPRTWADFVAFATATASMLGGSPGYGCVFENKLLYAASGYTVGTTYPPIRIFDGSFDREICTLPPTPAGVVPKAIVSMLAANGTIYLSTLDTGSDSTNWVGRVFSLDIATAALTPVGAAFTTGHVPYALAWHNGRLYCGTHRQVSTAVGKIYTILPDVDAAWTEDYDLASASMTGVASLLSFQGTLFVGCTAAAGTFAKVIKRATDGTYSTAETGSGGTAKANNGFLSLAEFSGSIYAGYWNADTPTAITSIRKSADGTTWVVSFTGATTTLRPIIALVVDNGLLYAIGGGSALTAAILRTPDGTTWTNLTAQLPDTLETALPVFGVVVF